MIKKALAILILLALTVGVLTWRLAERGLSARDEPSALEAAAAGWMRHLATPRSLRETRNPVAATPEMLAEARAHFADHCASCHGNDGRGQTEIGRNLYPRVPDMTQPGTQSLTDGELFAVIENGIRLTGMPAWGDGTPESARQSWSLVHFLRHLPKVTPEELEEMKALNPTSRRALEEEDATRRFLEQEDAPPPETKRPPRTTPDNSRKE
jgi:mono/diheme cytochrome c family protein